MKLFAFPVAPNPTRVRLYLAEKRAAGAIFDVEDVTVDLREQEQKSPEHLLRNPLAKLPVLEMDDGSFLTESTAIIEYLEERVPNPPMIGADTITRARTREMDRIVDMGILRPIAGIVHATKSPLGLPPNPAVAKSARESLPSSLQVIEDRLRDGRTHLMGDDVSIVDCTLAAALQFGRFANVEIGSDNSAYSDYEEIIRWDSAYRKRASAKQVLVL